MSWRRNSAGRKGHCRDGRGRLNILGGSEFRLRRGFAEGKTLGRAAARSRPIAVKVTGRYHDIGAFTADIANLSRIVTLNNLSIAPSTDKDRAGALSLEATAKTYRYLDPEEIAAQRAAAKPKVKK